MVILTSGTTGPPKGARIARASGLEPLAWYLSVVPIDAGSICLIPAPLFHAHGLGQFTIATALGCTVVLPRDVRRRGDARADRASSHRGDGGRPDDAESHHGPRSRRPAAGTTPAPCGSWCAAAPRSTRGWRARSWRSSGRCSTTCTAPPRWPGRRSRRREDLLAAPGTVGRPPPHTRLEILDDDGAPAAARHHGSHLRRPRDAVRGLHGPEQEPRARCRG